MDWKVTGTIIGVMPAAVIVGECIIRLPALRTAYADIYQVYPDAVLVFYSLIVAVIISIITATYFCFQLNRSRAAEIQEAVSCEERRLREKIEADFKKDYKLSYQKVAEDRRAVEEKFGELRSQVDELKITRLQVKAAEAEALGMKSDAVEAIKKVTATAQAAAAVRDGVERVEGVYLHLSQLLEKAIDDPVKIAAHLDPERAVRQIKKIQDALNRCYEYWELMDTLQYGQVIKQDDTNTEVRREAEQPREPVAVKQRQPRKEVPL